ncbi:aldehyde dehydrogenase family protein [Nitratireductor sp. ZSWI3]|nr:aldehyde dehydrogenase family protein [Nitratireductor sp. ZSWI3]MCR4265021.1 aldehyde dehydrogenase family protein [Nitratireductor sp. ZSWI3]
MFRLQRQELLRERAFIGGVWIGDPERPVANPATDAVVGHVPHLDGQASQAAIRAAVAAFRGWAGQSAFARADLLKRWFQLIMKHQEDLASILTAEQGKPLRKARAEIEYAARYVEYYGEEAKRIYGETVPSPFPDSRILVLRQPVALSRQLHRGIFRRPW